MGAKSRPRCAVLVVAALLPLSVAGCKDEDPVVSHASAHDADDPAMTACTVFAGRYRRAETKASRLRLADEVGRYAARSDNGAVSGRAGLVGRSASRGDTSWRAAAGKLLRACRDAGWRP
jgi:hypothetical protein